MNDIIEKLDHAVQMIEQTGVDYAKSRSLSWLMQEQRKVVLSEETRKQTGGTIADREDKARCSEAYRKHLEATKTAIYEELRTNAFFLRWRSEYESERSKLSLYKRQVETFRE